MLGAHLEAYINTLPVVNAIKLCNRYGRGENVGISKLPVELVLCVAEYIVQDERDRQLSIWTRDFQCFQLLCKPENHKSGSQLQAIDEMLHDDDPECELRQRPVEGSDPLLNQCVQKYLHKEWEEWQDVHHDRRWEWGARVITRIPATERNIFRINADLILKHFGLDVWTSNVRLDNSQVDSMWNGAYFCPPQTTVAWLKLPNKQTLERKWETLKI